MKYSGEIVSAVILVILMAVTFYISGTMQNMEWRRTIDYCDNRFGKLNWTFEDITGTDEASEIAGRFYIGQVWQCHNATETANKTIEWRAT